MQPSGSAIRLFGVSQFKSAVVVVVVALALLSAWRGGEAISAGDTTVLVSEPPDSGMDALGGGRLERVGGCLGASGSVIVWPNETEVVDDEPLTIRIPDDGTYALGEEVQVGGGFVLEHSSDDVDPAPYEVSGVTVPAECAKYDIFLAASDGW